MKGNKAPWRRIAPLVGMALVLMAAPGMTSAWARGSSVLAPTATASGWSLTDMALATAYFNTNVDWSTGFHLGLPPETPFQMLYSRPDMHFTVSPDTTLYVPVWLSDDAPPVIGEFPDVTNPSAVADYWFNWDQLGAESLTITVDGVTTTLGPGYAVGVETPLADGGTHYTVVAAFLAPLSPGTHEVVIHGRLTGDAWRALPDLFPDGVTEGGGTYSVIVASQTVTMPGEGVSDVARK